MDEKWRSVYVLSDDKHRIYRVNPDGSKLEALAIVADYGLALSPSGRRLAFWRMAPEPEDNWVLVVYDVAEQKEIRTWPLPHKYASEPYGFDIAFADEERVYARTYDEGLGEVQTPLKLFNAATGTVTKITDRCSAVVATRGGIYFVTHDPGERHFQLKKLTKRKETLPQVLVYRFGFRRVAITGKERWLAVETRGKAGLLDTATNRIVNEAKGCDSVTMLSDGRVIYVREGRLSSDQGICKQVRRGK